MVGFILTIVRSMLIMLPELTATDLIFPPHHSLSLMVGFILTIVRSMLISDGEGRLGQ
jgi:hypothetical protein